MRNYYVYFEHVLIINLIFNYLILIFTAKISYLNPSRKQLFLGALLGSAYSFMLLVPYLGVFINALTKFLMSLLMVLVSFWPVTIKKYFQAVVSLYLITFLLGGTVFGLSYFFKDSTFVAYFRVLDIVTDNLLVIFATVIVIYLSLGRIMYNYLKKNMAQGLLKTSIGIFFNGQQLNVDAMLDTGNHLRDPISKHPVIIVEYEAVAAIIPQEIRAYFMSDVRSLDSLMASIVSSPMAAKFRVIPFKSLGEDNGILLGFRPEKLVVAKAGTTFMTSQVVIGVYNQRLSPEGNYRALLHPEILAQGHY